MNITIVITFFPNITCIKMVNIRAEILLLIYTNLYVCIKFYMILKFYVQNNKIQYNFL